MSDTAYWRAAGINNGLTAAELGISYLLPRQIGFSRAFDILLTGRDVTAAEALHIGMVSQVVPGEQLLDTSYGIAERIIGFSHVGVELTKQLLWASYDAGGLHGHMNHEGNAELYVRLTTGNFDEKIRAWRRVATPSTRMSDQSELRFDGKVVVITGAGRNLGREYALLLASRGARASW